MKPIFTQGKLITWKDDRGFGFIKPDDGGKNVFLHISALKGASRRPKVGDTIAYEPVAEPNGKVRAATASIQNSASRSSPNRKRSTPSLVEIVMGVVLLTGARLYALMSARTRYPVPVPSGSPSPSTVTAIAQPECTIKGNISISTGHKVYHLPGMEDYESTVIDPTQGERWFCTESEAIAQGWRKAPR